jgi:dolichyl-phosphate-mannose-protein mannosyltransferase
MANQKVQFKRKPSDNKRGGSSTTQLNKKDLFTIVTLSIVFLSLATWNLGNTQIPTTSDTFYQGQSFYLDLGNPQEIGSLYFLLHDGSFNLTVYSGSPENWALVTSGASFSDYYKWNEVGIHETAQYIKVDFNQTESPYYAIIDEIAATNPSNQQINIADLINLNSTNPNLNNLIDEQTKVELPATYMTQTYFDEIYFVRTAEQYLHLQSPYEWTHPPLGKLIQAAGIVAFGFSPFGWRFTGVIFGTLMIPIIFMLGKKLFGTWIGAFASAFLLSFDFMHFTMARMGTADTYVVFFSLLSQLFFIVYFTNVVKKGWKTSTIPLFLAVIFFMLGFSTKWLVLYSALGMLALLAALRIRELSKMKTSLASKYAAFFDHPFLILLGFIAVGIGIYFAIYIPDMLTGRPFFGTNGVIDLQFAMYNYHSTLVATHSFSSAWWAWPIMVSPKGYVPLWLDVTYLPNQIDSTISVFGNPAVWWIGFISMITLAERAIRGKELVKSIKRRLSKKPKNLEAIAPAEAGKEIIPETETSISPSTTDQEKESPAQNENSISPQTPPSTPSENESPQHLGRSWDIAAIYITVVFFFSWLPYILISRVTFIYHYYVSTPLLCLATAYFINKYWNTKWGKVAAIALFVSVIALFIVFYPVISGVPVSTSWIYKLKWFPSWFFAP